MMNRPNTILLVENDATAAVPLTIGLQDQGFRAIHASNGNQGLEYAQTAKPDLVLVNALLPQMDGFAVCRALRQASAVPVIMLSDCDHEADRIKGLEIGADDYLIQPFSFRELLAHVRAILRRRELDRGEVLPPSDRIAAGDIALDRTARQVWRNGRLIELRRLEFELLGVLMENVGQAMSRHALLDQVWGENWIGDPRTVDVHIRWLRQKLEDDASAPCYIQTVHGFGYRFVDPATLIADAA